MWYRLRIPLILCFVMGLLAFVHEFIPHPIAASFRQEVTTSFRIMGGFAMFIGAYSLLHMHVTRIRRKQSGWGYSVFVFLGAAAMIASGVVEEIVGAMRTTPAPPDAFSLFQWLYDYVQVPCGATIFSILAFFMASAAFRTFRARNVGAAMLLVAAIIVMFGRVPVSEWVGGWVGKPGLFPGLADVLMEYPNMAAKRGILMGISLGMISQSLRVLLGIERSYLGGRD